MSALSGTNAVARFLATQGGDLHISKATAARALARFKQAHDDDADLPLHDIEQDEATRAPANARKNRRLRRDGQLKRLRKFERNTARQLIAKRAATPAPSRGASRLALRLIAEREAAEQALVESGVGIVGEQVAA